MVTAKIVEIPKHSSNREFFEQYAAPGRVGLVGGDTFIEKVIKLAERRLNDDRSWGQWTHAMLFQGARWDGHHWVIESDLEGGLKHMRLGVQENRLAKYFDDETFPLVAVLDFGLDAGQTEMLLAHALEMVATGATYSLRELLGTAVALHNPKSRGRRNALAQQKSMYCSGLVQYVFQKIGLDLVPGVHPSLGTPEELARSPLTRTLYVLKR